jgi:D-glycero-D-manno-heptose 1,7-bisphosphate phosphatase
LLKKVVFLDRDGVINFDSPDYIKSREEFEFIPGSVEAVRELTTNGFDCIVITNQSALARNLISAAELGRIHTMMKKAIASAAGRITDIFWCPHLPDDGCDCRKPEPGLIYQARRKYDINLAAAVMVGDSARDIECARRAGVGRALLVQSGKDGDVQGQLKARQMVPDHVAEDLRAAVKWILRRQQ